MGDAETGNDQSAVSEGEGHRPASRGEPIVRGVVKIDFNDDEAVDEFAAGLGAHIVKKVRESGTSVGEGREVRVVSVGGVPYAEYREEQEALHAEYQAILSLLPSRKNVGTSDFLTIVDAYIQRELSAGRGAGLIGAVETVQGALDWGDVDDSGIGIYDGTEVWEAVADYLLTFSYDDGGGDSLAVLDFGRGVTYLAIDTNEKRGVYDYEVVGDVTPNDWDTVREFARSEMHSSASYGEPLGKWPDRIGVSSPVTADDVRETFRELFMSDSSVAEEYNEWMTNNGYQALPIGTNSERQTLADAYVDLVLDEGA